MKEREGEIEYLRERLAEKETEGREKAKEAEQVEEKMRELEEQIAEGK